MGRARARGTFLGGCSNMVHSLNRKPLLFATGRGACSSRHENQQRCLAMFFRRLVPNDSTGGNSRSFQQMHRSPKVWVSPRGTQWNFFSFFNEYWNLPIYSLLICNLCLFSCGLPSYGGIRSAQGERSPVILCFTLGFPLKANFLKAEYTQPAQGSWLVSWLSWFSGFPACGLPVWLSKSTNTATGNHKLHALRSLEVQKEMVKFLKLWHLLPQHKSGLVAVDAIWERCFPTGGLWAFKG